MTPAIRKGNSNLSFFFALAGRLDTLRLDSTVNITMNKFRPNIKTLWAMVVLAIAYCGLIYFRHALTGTRLLDGGIGVMLGLFICAHPAANGVNLMFLERTAYHQLPTGWSNARWLALNMLVLIAGWIVIVIGAAQFSVR
jgi:hypothetical protein